MPTSKQPPAAELVYPCPPRRALGATVALMMLGCGAGLLPAARSGHWIVSIDGFTMSAAHSVAALWVMVAFSLIGGLMAAAHLALRVAVPMAITLARDGLHAPLHLWSIERTVVPYRSVRKVRVERQNGVAIAMRITHAQGRLKLRAADFPDGPAFAAFDQHLRGRITLAGGTA